MSLRTVASFRLRSSQLYALVAGLAVALIASTVAAGTAAAAYPGENGELLISECGACEDDGASRIWTIEPNGADRTEIAAPRDYDPAVTATGDRIYYTVARAENPILSDIFTAKVDGSDETQVTSDAIADFDPDVSPDGTRILFTSAIFEDGALNRDIYTANADGSDRTRLTQAAGDDTEAVFSPDGNSIAFVSERSGNPDVWVMNVDGSNQRALVETDGDDNGPDYSPDGELIAYRSQLPREDGNGVQSDIHVVGADGSNPRVAISDPDRTDFAPTFSPDGEQIAYVSTTLPDPSTERTFDIYRANADGTGITNVTSTPQIDELHVEWQPITQEIPAACSDGRNPVLKLGTSGPETLIGTDADDAIFGRAGRDTLIGKSGDDCLYGEGDRDVLRGKKGADLLSGGGDRDTLKGNGGADVVDGGDAADRIRTAGGEDDVKGGKGGDTINSGGGDDRVRGNGGKDRIRGGGGDDVLKGGPGNDVIRGGGGRNKINCGGGKDKVVVTSRRGDKVAGNCEKVKVR